MSASHAAGAPMDDLSLIQDMLKYRLTDAEVADAVIGKMANHRWYLTQEVIPFALFSSSLSNEAKHNIAMRILTVEQPESFRRGKPLFPDITANTKLEDLVGPESYFLFEVLNIGRYWLQQPVDMWQYS